MVMLTAKTARRKAKDPISNIELPKINYLDHQKNCHVSFYFTSWASLYQEDIANNSR